MGTVSLTCDGCGKKFFRYKNWVLRAKRLGWRKNFCSWFCRVNSQNKHYLCDNPKCEKPFRRTLSQAILSQSHYCSRSCAVSVNNSKFPKRPAVIHSCPICQKTFKGETTFCSRKCKYESERIERPEIVSWIRKFHQKHGRIPLKLECVHYRVAQRRFGSWNKAVSAAGFKTNAALFAKKFVAKDGHKCDSLAEKIIDDWLNAKKIAHQIHVRYGGTKFTTDFLVNGTFVEFFGLQGQLKKYDKLMQEKLRWITSQKLKLVSIYPNDLFPKSKLDTLLTNI